MTREPAVIDLHLNGGFTRVRFDHYRHNVDVPTEAIPSHLRAVGSQILLALRYMRTWSI